VISGTDFAERYREMRNEDILKLASHGGLLPEADSAFEAERRRRSISAKDVSAMHLSQKEAEVQSRVGNNPTVEERVCGSEGSNF